MKSKQKSLIVLSFVIVLLFLGCASQTEYQRQAKFIESEYAPYAGKGTSSIVGQAFLKTRGGDIKFAAGNMVTLNPVTTYSTEWFNIYILQNRRMELTDPRTTPFNRQTTADGNGNFEFRNLRAGEYYIATYVYWQVPSSGGLRQTGRIFGKRVKVGKGESVKVILTH